MVRAVMAEWHYKCDCKFARYFGTSRVSMEFGAQRHHYNHPDKTIHMYRPDGRVWQTIEPSTPMFDMPSEPMF